MAAEQRETTFDDIISLMNGYDVRNDSQAGENISEEDFLRYLGKIDIQTGKPLLVSYDKSNPSLLNVAIISAGDPLNIPYNRAQLKQIFDYACEKKFTDVLQVLYIFQQQVNDSLAIKDGLKLPDWTWIDFQPITCCTESEEAMLEYTGKGTAKKNRTPQFQLTPGEFDRLVTLANLAASNNDLKEKITDAITNKTKKKVHELLKLACRHGYLQLRDTILTAKKLLDDIEGNPKFKLATVTTLVNEHKLVEAFLEGDNQNLHADKESAYKMGRWLMKRISPDKKKSSTTMALQNYLERCIKEKEHSDNAVSSTTTMTTAIAVEKEQEALPPPPVSSAEDVQTMNVVGKTSPQHKYKLASGYHDGNSCDFGQPSMGSPINDSESIKKQEIHNSSSISHVSETPSSENKGMNAMEVEGAPDNDNHDSTTSAQQSTKMIQDQLSDAVRSKRKRKLKLASNETSMDGNETNPRPQKKQKLGEAEKRNNNSTSSNTPPTLLIASPSLIGSNAQEVKEDSQATILYDSQNRPVTPLIDTPASESPNWTFSSQPENGNHNDEKNLYRKPYSS